ncbi:hypothetical protein CHU98_g9024 [Xylaria longipes]|nr:hypothetical protein CHU98_g9024 [Xylaria longipes]
MSFYESRGGGKSKQSGSTTREVPRYWHANLARPRFQGPGRHPYPCSAIWPRTVGTVAAFNTGRHFTTAAKAPRYAADYVIQVLITAINLAVRDVAMVHPEDMACFERR